MCYILVIYTWQLKNGEAVVTSQTMWISARAYMLRLLHSKNKHDNSHYRLVLLENITFFQWMLFLNFLFIKESKKKVSQFPKKY